MSEPANTEPTLSDLKQELALLMASITEDADGSSRDHWPNGRWPMVHRLADRIRAMEAASVKP